MNPSYSDKLKPLHGYENYIAKPKPMKPWELNEKPLPPQATAWALIKQMIKDCERLHTDDEEMAEMLLDFVRELMSKEG